MALDPEYEMVYLENRNFELSTEINALRREIDEKKLEIGRLKRDLREHEEEKEHRRIVTENLVQELKESRERGQELYSENKVLYEENENLKKTNNFLEKDQARREKFWKGENMKLAEAREALKLENNTIKAKKQQGARKRAKSYNELRSRNSKVSRVEEGVRALSDTAGQDSVQIFSKDLFKELGNQGTLKNKLTEEEAVIFYHDVDLKREQYLKMKRNLRKFGVPDPLPSLRLIRAEEELQISKDLFTIKSSRRFGKGTGDVHVAQLKNVAEFLKRKSEDLYAKGHLKFDDVTQRKLWLGIMGDKGSDEFKLSISIANVDLPNSAHNLVPVGIFDDEESLEAITYHLSDVIEQINILDTLELILDGKAEKIPIMQFLGGDLKFQYSMQGLDGANATYSCMHFLVKGKLIVGTYVRGSNIEMRCEACYHEQVVKLRPKRKNQKMKAAPTSVFKKIILANIVPPPLHINMGVGQRYIVDTLLDLAYTEDNGTSIHANSKSATKKKGVKIASENLTMKMHEVAELRKFISSVVVVKRVFQKFNDRSITPSTSESTCKAERCLFRDVEMNTAESFDGRTIQCPDCFDHSHAVCSGAWTPELWILADGSDPDVSCLRCCGKSGVGVERDVDKTIQLLEQRLADCELEIGKSKEEHDQYMKLVGGQTPTRKKLEQAWSDHGVQMCTWQQSFTGNQMMKLLQEDVVDQYMAVFQPRPELIFIRNCAVALGKIAKFSSSKILLDDEIEEEQRVQTFGS